VNRSLNFFRYLGLGDWFLFEFGLFAGSAFRFTALRTRSTTAAMAASPPAFSTRRSLGFLVRGFQFGNHRMLVAGLR
jgi:hypothetical protein